MLHVFSPISGEDIAVLHTDELEETSAETLKEHLAPIVGITRFRQRLFSEDGSEIGCEDLSLSQTVQLVLLQLVEPNAEQEQQMLNACWEMMLNSLNHCWKNHWTQMCQYDLEMGSKAYTPFMLQLHLAACNVHEC